MTRFRDYKSTAAEWITVVESEVYPDYLDSAMLLYEGPLRRFRELAGIVESSAQLLVAITQEPDPERTQLLRIFHRCVSPDTSVEMLKRKRKTKDTIRSFGPRFRPLPEVQAALRSRPENDEALAAVLYEYKNRGSKGYALTEAFFLKFQQMFSDELKIEGPRKAGRDVMLNEVLPGFSTRLPADFLISATGGAPLVVGFARYDSDRGGAQEDDRTGGNRDKATVIAEYARSTRGSLKVLFLNDGPGLLLGSMWDDYAELEDYDAIQTMVCTLKMLDDRLTRSWIEA